MYVHIKKEEVIRVYLKRITFYEEEIPRLNELKKTIGVAIKGPKEIKRIDRLIKDYKDFSRSLTEAISRIGKPDPYQERQRIKAKERSRKKRELNNAKTK